MGLGPGLTNDIFGFLLKTKTVEKPVLLLELSEKDTNKKLV